MEYTLILTVIILLFLGTLYQFNSAFKVFVNNYFGNYTACLLEAGELPTLFGGTGAQCSATFKTFNASDGTPLVSGGSGGSNGGGGSNGNNGVTGGGNGGRDNNRGNTRNSRSDGQGSSGSGGGGGGGSGSINRFGNQTSRPRQRVVGKVADGSTYTGSTEASSRKGRVVGQISGPAVGENPKTTLDRRFVTSRDSSGERNAPIKSDPGSDDARMRSKKTKFELRKPAAKMPESEDTIFTVDGMLRILLIAALLIALFVLISGQAASINKSWEKE